MGFSGLRVGRKGQLRLVAPRAVPLFISGEGRVHPRGARLGGAKMEWGRRCRYVWRLGMEDLMSGANGLLERLEGYGRLALGMGTRGLLLHCGATVDWIQLAFGRSTGVQQRTYRVLSPIVVFCLELKSFLVGSGSVLVWPWETLCSEGAKNATTSLRLARCRLFLSCLSRNPTTLKLNPVDGVKWLL